MALSPILLLKGVKGWLFPDQKRVLGIPDQGQLQKGDFF